MFFLLNHYQTLRLLLLTTGGKRLTANIIRHAIKLFDKFSTIFFHLFRFSQILLHFYLAIGLLRLWSSLFSINIYDGLRMTFCASYIDLQIFNWYSLFRTYKTNLYNLVRTFQIFQKSTIVWSFWRMLFINLFFL